MVRICLKHLNSFIENNSIVQYNSLPWFLHFHYSMFRGFEPGAFKMVKISMKKIKCFMQIRTSVLQSGYLEQNATTELHKTIQY